MDMIRFHYSDLRNTEPQGQIKHVADLNKLMISFVSVMALNSTPLINPQPGRTANSAKPIRNPQSAIKN